MSGPDVVVDLRASAARVASLRCAADLDEAGRCVAHAGEDPAQRACRSRTDQEELTLAARLHACIDTCMDTR